MAGWPRAGWYLFNAGATNEAIAAAESATNSGRTATNRARCWRSANVAGAEADESIAFLKGADYAGYYDVNWALRIGEKLTVRGLPLAARPWLNMRWRATHGTPRWPSPIPSLQKPSWAGGGGCPASGHQAQSAKPAAVEELAALYCVLGRWKLSPVLQQGGEIAPSATALLQMGRCSRPPQQYSRAGTHQPLPRRHAG